jgi:hypothetical protein
MQRLLNQLLRIQPLKRGPISNAAPFGCCLIESIFPNRLPSKADYAAFQEARDYVENWLVRLGQPCNLEKKSFSEPHYTISGAFQPHCTPATAPKMPPK